MTDAEPKEEPVEYPPSYWRKVYLFVLGFLAAFCLFMYLFTRFTA